MCKSRDPFFYTGVIVRARCARYKCNFGVNIIHFENFKNVVQSDFRIFKMSHTTLTYLIFAMGISR